jgi:hypothetical protein
MRTFMQKLNKVTEGLLAEERIGCLLVFLDHTESHLTRTILPLLGIILVTHLIDLFPSLSGKAPTRGLTTSALARGLLAACHGNGAVAKFSRGFLLSFRISN